MHFREKYVSFSILDGDSADYTVKLSFLWWNSVYFGYSIAVLIEKVVKFDHF